MRLGLDMEPRGIRGQAFYSSGYIMCYLEKKRNGRASEGVKSNMDRLINCWFQILGLSIKGYPLYTIENFENLIEILVDL